jgi:hypothetical protein
VAANRPELHVDADIGLGALRIDDGSSLIDRDFGWMPDSPREVPPPMDVVCGGPR